MSSARPVVGSAAPRPCNKFKTHRALVAGRRPGPIPALNEGQTRRLHAASRERFASDAARMRAAHTARLWAVRTLSADTGTSTSMDAQLAHSTQLRSVADEALASLAEAVPFGSVCALLDHPDHPNVGDSAIWLGEREFARA